MEKMKEAYDEIFLNSEARYIIPAIRYLVTLVKIRDAATASYDKLCNIEFTFVQTEREYPLCVIVERRALSFPSDELFSRQ